MSIAPGTGGSGNEQKMAVNVVVSGATPTSGRSPIKFVPNRKCPARGGRRVKRNSLKCSQTVKRSWVVIILAYLYSFIVGRLVLAPLHAIQTWVKTYSSRAQATRTEQRYLNIMNSTESLKTWVTTASYLDNHRGMQKWKEVAPNKEDCDAEGLIQDTFCAKALIQYGNEVAIGDFLRSQLHRTAHGMTSPCNYQYYTGTIRCLEEYNDTIVKIIETFCQRVSENEVTRAPPLSDELNGGEDSFAKQDPLLQPESKKDAAIGGEDNVYKGRKNDFNGSGLSRTKRRPDAAALSNSTARPHTSTYISSLLDWAHGPHLSRATHLSDTEKFKVLRDTLRSYGRSALMLSGGSTLGVYHTGVVRALFESGLLPDIISGSSAGSIIAAIICTKTNDQLRDFLSDSILTVETLQLAPFDEGGIFSKLKRLLRTGACMDVRTLMECLRSNVGDLTFKEAYRKTGRILNVCVTSDKYSGSHMDRHMLLNYVTSPNVVVWSAVSASCALPGLFTAVQLIEKLPDGTFGRFLPGQLWCDGSVARDLPRESLSSLFNVNYFIVSQVNPHIIPFLKKPVSPLLYKQRRPRKILSSIWYGFCREMRHWILKLFTIGVFSKTGRWDLPYFFLTQRYDGDILILPIGNVLHAVPDYFNIVANPSPEYIAFVTSKAQLRTWPHLNQIRHVTMIERALVREISILKNRIGNRSENVVL
ncbi:hypothetical protein DQ04_03171040 [Trypanosoma grayi]|uniref:hypothetical protein n=1 Tax=Trypanosoma grayi TaxID=71804 RepID=UPI0004F42185|nr:hypothetical protein DQ04_03171040 [Trypanosoma grayi]KEG10900.1 hypothetical protein DQ04_03171040 [Trypanosoma grayi]